MPTAIRTLGWTHFDRMTAAGYIWNFAGENIAAGTSTASSTMVLWMGSPGHRANILQMDFREIGVGYVNDGADVGNVREDREPVIPGPDSGR